MFNSEKSVYIWKNKQLLSKFCRMYLAKKYKDREGIWICLLGFLALNSKNIMMISKRRMEGRDILFDDALNTFFLQLYCNQAYAEGPHW